LLFRGEYIPTFQGYFLIQNTGGKKKKDLNFSTQEDHKFKTSLGYIASLRPTLGYIVRPLLKKPNQNKNQTTIKKMHFKLFRKDWYYRT
jgi:hypothetical protein